MEPNIVVNADFNLSELSYKSEEKNGDVDATPIIDIIRQYPKRCDKCSRVMTPVFFDVTRTNEQERAEYKIHYECRCCDNESDLTIHGENLPIGEIDGKLVEVNGIVLGNVKEFHMHVKIDVPIIYANGIKPYTL